MPEIQYPNLKGKADDKVVEAVANLYDYISRHELSLKQLRAQMNLLPSREELQNQIHASATEQALATLPMAQLASQGTTFGIARQGSILPIPANSILYDNATANTIKWYSTGLVLYPTYGGTIAIPDTTVAQPIISVGGLTPATTYFFYPYYSTDLRMIQFAQVVGGVGAPPAAYTAKNILAAQVTSGDGNIALSTVSSVTAAATGGGGGGGSGGGSGCIRSSMWIEAKRGIITLGRARVGEEILGPEGWTIIKAKHPSMQPTFLRFRFGLGDFLDVTPTHPMAAHGAIELTPAKSWCMSDLIGTRSGLPARIIGIEVLEESDGAEEIECAPQKYFFCGGEKPNLILHNFMTNK